MMYMKKPFLRICVALLMIICTTSCKGFDLWLAIVNAYQYFVFRNDTDYDLLLFFDYNASDDIITLSNESYCIFNARGNNSTDIATPHNDSWDKHVKDSLHLYVINDKISYEYWISHSIEECLTEDYIEHNLLARMTLTLEDVFPGTDPPKEIVFPPKDDSYYNTIYYNYQ